MQVREEGRNGIGAIDFHYLNYTQFFDIKTLKFPQILISNEPYYFAFFYLYQVQLILSHRKLRGDESFFIMRVFMA